MPILPYSRRPGECCGAFPKGTFFKLHLLSNEPLDCREVKQTLLQTRNGTSTHGIAFLEGIYSLLFSAPLSSKGLLKPIKPLTSNWLLNYPVATFKLAIYNPFPIGASVCEQFSRAFGRVG